MKPGRWILGTLIVVLLTLTVACDYEPEREASVMESDSTDDSPLTEGQAPAPAVVQVEPMLAWDWRLEAELSHNYYFGETDSLVFIYSHDGGISGHHDEEKLYAVSKLTGKVRWQIDADYTGFHFALTEDQEEAAIFTSNSREYHLRQVDVSHGEARWADYALYAEPRDVADSMTAFGQTVIVFDRWLEDGETGEMKAYDMQSGEEKWSAMFEGPARVLSQEPGDPYPVLAQEGRLIALDPDTGEEIWTAVLKGELEGWPRFVVLDHQEEPLHERWIFHEGEGVYVDMASGAVKHRYIAQKDDQAIFSVNERYWIINNKLYDTFEERELWSVPDSYLSEPTLDGELLFVLIDGVPAALNWTDGSIVWKMELDALSSPLESYAGRFVVLDERLVVLPYGMELWIVEKSTGDIVYRMDDFAFDYPVSIQPVSRNGLIRKSGDRLYIGSANGRFASIALEAFLAEVNRALQEGDILQ